MTTHKPLPETLEGRYALVQDRIAAASKRAGRRPEDVILVAVTKTASPEDIRAMIDLGHRDFGENRAQQLAQRGAMIEEYFSRLKVLPHGRLERDSANANLFRPAPKIDLIPTGSDGQRPVRWHMIGHLQRNKARKVVEWTRLIHSVDSLRLAEELQVLALKRDQVIEVLIQVNCSGEAQKFGVPVPAAIPLAEQIETMINVKVRGLMTMAAETETPDEARAAFARCRDLYEEMRKIGFSEGKFNLLSMGMSNDFDIAIEEGANIVRVGSAIFGKPAAIMPEVEEKEAPEPEDAETPVEGI